MSEEPKGTTSVEPTSQQARSDDETALISDGQRKVNLIWEITQSTIAICVTLTTLYVAAILSLGKSESSALLLSNAFFLVIGFYFGRTNHQRVGGVGPISGR